MIVYQYRARRGDGEEVSGETAARNGSDVLRMLDEQQLTVIELREVGPAADSPPLARLSAAESVEWSDQVSRVAATRQPLASGLRAAADESSSPRVAAALRRLSTQIEQGQSLEAVLDESASWLPAPVRGLVLTAVRSGNLPAALSDLVEQQRAAQLLRRKTLEGLAYSLVVTVLAGGLLVVLLFIVGGAFEKMFREFALRLPLLTQILFWWRDTGIWVALLIILAVVAAAWIYRRVRGEAAWHRLLAEVPVFGPLLAWRGLAEWLGMVSVLVKYGASLPDALRLTADGSNHAVLCELSRELAEGVCQGRTLSQCLAADRRVPAALVPLVRWGETQGSLVAAFEVAQEMFSRRVQIRAHLLQTILPPILFIGIGCCILMIVGGLFIPLAVLLEGLS